MPETIAVRTGEEVAVGRLCEFLRDKLPGAEDGIELQQFPNGHSNLTYLLRAGEQEYVLRRPPLGPVAPKAHDMVREFHILRAVHRHYPEAPKPFAVCEDAGILGAPFFVMERRHGDVLRERAPAEMEPRAISEAFLDAMVRLHSIDVRSDDLAGLGKPEGYVERQVHGWADRWERARTGDGAAMDEVVRWLAANVPAPLTPSLIHNDYKLDNVMLAAGPEARIAAVLDWEMATVGDPLSDLGLTLCYWHWATDPEVRAAGIPALTREAGWLTREELVSRYADGTGRDVKAVGYYEVLGVFKLAVIIQQIYARYFRGQTQDERFQGFGLRAEALAKLAARRAERCG
jgi:aminoglycoside phosphotransferase (APT) family kinase protein